MPAHTLADTRTKRPLTCDVCSMPIEKESVVAICGRCKRVRHEQACAAAACPTCGWHVQRKAVYLGSRTVGYL